MAQLDWIIIALYFVILFAIAAWVMSKKQKDDLKLCFPNDPRSRKKVDLLYQLSQLKVKSRRRWNDNRVIKVMKKKLYSEMDR